MYRRRTLLLALTVAMSAPMAVAAPAQATATTVNMRKVNFGARTIPGSTCFSRKPIKLHKGYGRGGKRLVVSVSKPTFANVTGNRRVEAFVPASCTTGSGVAAGQVKQTIVVFGSRGRKVVALGVISARQQWARTHNTLLAVTRAKRGIVTVRESVYGSADRTCCPSFHATSRWVLRKGKLRPRSSTMQASDLLVIPNGVGKARLGMTLRELRARYRNVQYYSYGPAATCSGGATFGAGYSQENEENEPVGAVFKHGRIVQLTPYSNNGTTSRGVGQYSSIADVKRAYPGRVRLVQSGAGLQVRFAGSSYYLPLTYEDYGTFVSTSAFVYAGSAPTLPSCGDGRGE